MCAPRVWGLVMRVLLLPALALAACAPTAAAPGAEDKTMIAIADVKGAPGECSLAVRFGSYAMGIDRGAAEEIGVLLTSDPTVTAVTRHRWGMEGEYTLCVQLRSGAEASALAERIRPLLPAKPRGPIEVIPAGAARIRAPAR